MDERGFGRYFSLLASCGGHVEMRRGRQNRIQNFEKDIFISISLVISTRMFKEMSRIRSNSARISAKTLQPALAAGCLFA